MLRTAASGRGQGAARGAGEYQDRAQRGRTRTRPCGRPAPCDSAASGRCSPAGERGHDLARHSPKSLSAEASLYPSPRTVSFVARKRPRRGSTPWKEWGWWGVVFGILVAVRALLGDSAGRSGAADADPGALALETHSSAEARTRMIRGTPR